MYKSLLLLLVVIGFVGCGQSEPTPTDRLAMAAEYLWSQQGEDGGWHSEVHGILRGGQAWTPFVLNALLQVPEDVVARPDSGAERGFQFLREHINEDGVLGLANGPVLEYPNYATAYALKVFAEHGSEADSALVRTMAEYLAGEHFTEQRGIAEEDHAYGGWGFGETNLSDGEFGHIDLSHSRRALQGLQVARWADAATFESAQDFLRLIQKRPEERRLFPPGNVFADSSIYDGGFYASPTADGINKGNAELNEAGERMYFRSYASATADGILALLASGLEPTDARILDAMAWLRNHPDWETPAGIPTDDPGQWHRVMFFYHIWVRADAYSALNESGDWQTTVFDLISPHQHDDGHFANPDGAPNKEDDPILATAMMVETLMRIVEE